MKQKFIDVMCIECKEAIYNPLCPRCLSREIAEWLGSRCEIRNIILEDIKKVLKATRAHSPLSKVEFQRCIKCKNKTAALCPYCFTERIYNRLKKERAGRKILKEFLEFFNFDFEHTYLAREAERLGVL